VLADAFTRAAEDKPVLMVDFATLTGAARIALGPDLPALFASSDDLAAEAETASREVDDPLWRMPLWEPYSEMLKSEIADVANAGGAPMAGCITAAMFLRRFVPDEIEWAHLDTYAWRDAASPGRPKGGEALGLRAVFALLQRRYPTG
jgi:leucyl aminopeptidase